jgi:hypothetical protein
MVESRVARGAGAESRNNPPLTSENADFFRKQLARNAPVFVQRAVGDESPRHTGALVGNFRDTYLVIGIFDGAEFAVGEKLLVRIALGAHLVGFATEVLKRVDDPPLYLLKFPQTLEAVNLRKAQRIQAFFPADVVVQNQGGDTFLLKTRVLDISAGGCSFRSKTKLPSSATVQLSFSLPGERLIQNIRGSVIDCTIAGLVYHTRCRFSSDAASAPIVQEIAKWVSEGLKFASVD